MTFDVFVNFKNNCRQAVEFYAGVFGLKTPDMMTFGDAPPSPEFPVKEEEKKLIMYTSLMIGGNNVMFSDSPSDMPYVAGNNITLSIGSKDEEEITKLFNKMKEGGKVIMPLQKTFWSKRYGMLVDKFGIPWMFSAEEGGK